METERIVVIGAGGMARCVLDLVDAINAHGERQIEVVGMIATPAPDDEGLEMLADRGVRYLGGDDAWAKVPTEVGFIIGIGNGRARRAIYSHAFALGYRSPTLVHPNVHMGHDVQVGEGSVICSHVSMENHIRIGRHVHVNQNSTIGHDCILKDFVTVSPLVAVSGNVTAHPGAFIGTGSAVREKTTIGTDATVGMGSTVLNDVPPSSLVFGNPARKAGGLDGAGRVNLRGQAAS